MQVGDKFSVIVLGVDTGQLAEVKEMADGTVTIEFPGTRFVAATKTEISTLEPTPVEPATETIITGVDRVSQTPTIVNDGHAESISAPAQPTVPVTDATAVAGQLTGNEQIVATPSAEPTVEAGTNE